MGYLLVERCDDGTSTVVGEAIYDLFVAKIIAARRASRSRRVTLVRDLETGVELARFDGSSFVPPKSVQRIKAINAEAHEGPTETLTRRKIG
jgi:hypothetical protein